MKWFCISLAIVAVALPAGAQPARPVRPAKGVGPVMERLDRMSPDQRKRMLERLPAERREKIENRLDEYNNMPPAQRERLRTQYENFQKLKPEQQQELRQQYRRFRNLPDGRRKEVRRELQRLQRLAADERQERLKSETFRSQFNEDERAMLEKITSLTPAEAPVP